MTRRLAILALVSMPLGSWRGVSMGAAQKPGPAWLTIDLNQWSGLTVVYRNQEIHLRAQDVFDALKEA